MTKIILCTNKVLAKATFCIAFVTWIYPIFIRYTVLSYFLYRLPISINEFVPETYKLMNSSEKIKFVKEVYKGELVGKCCLDEKISEPQLFQAQEISYFFVEWIIINTMTRFACWHSDFYSLCLVIWWSKNASYVAFELKVFLNESKTNFLELTLIPLANLN